MIHCPSTEHCRSKVVHGHSPTMTREKLKISESTLNHQLGPGHLSALHRHNDCALPHPTTIATTHSRGPFYIRSQSGVNRTMLLLSLTLLVLASPKQFLIWFFEADGSIASFFSTDDLKYTFGVDHISKVPPHREFYPSAVYDEADWYGPKPPLLRKLIIELEEGNGALHLEFYPSSRKLVAPHVTVVERNRPDGGGKLVVHTDWPDRHNCHFQHTSNHTYAAVSNCDQNLKGVVVHQGRIYVIHPIPERHMSKRTRRSVAGPAELGLHVIYKRAAVADQGGEFCGVDAGYSRQEVLENEAGVHEDAFVLGQRLTRDSDLVVELAVFVDENLWRHFSSKHGSYASQKLQEYALTMLNNIQIMYNQPSPPLTFRIVRYEVYQSQPSPIAPHLHENGNAQRYLDVFCRYQRSLGATDWDHALMLTGHDIHRGGGATSISGIARLGIPVDGMCDPWNTCTLAEGLDFTSAFIGTHELGHSVGMRHDEPYCPSNYIMSSSLGPGKVTWSSCSIRDFQSFIQRLDARGKNCLRNAFQREQLPLSNPLKPGQIYDAHRQCSLMHGTGYIQISPRQDHPNGICNMMWCGQGQFGRIITSHPALEGTSCGQNMWCQLGRCVPFTGFGTPLTTPVPPPLVVGGYTTTTPPPPPPPTVSYPNRREPLAALYAPTYNRNYAPNTGIKPPYYGYSYPAPPPLPVQPPPAFRPLH